MLIQLRISRYLPEKDEKPYYETYQVQAEPTDRVLDLLEYVRGDLDGSLGYRRSCAHGVCGSDAMRINGKNALACKVLVQDLGTDVITVEPMLGFKVIKDLIVDMEPFFNQYKSILPYLINDDPEP
jgi:succinate dehydrogenase / fumarate reductase, iron-sulfur subunit